MKTFKKISFKVSIGLMFLVISVFVFGTPELYAANYPLEITNIKPAGTGEPAISENNRIFRAYPGIEYNIRAAVIGGVYPYMYSLSNAPSGMTIDSLTGEISWPNPQSNSGTITVSVTDQENTTVTADWAVTVTTNGFWFVDDSYEGTSDGSYSAPFKSLNEMHSELTNTEADDILYIRGGSYTLEATLGDAGRFNIGGWYGYPHRPRIWIGYPGETVNIDVNELGITSHQYWFDNLRFFNGKENLIWPYHSGDINYTTIRRCHFEDMIGVPTYWQGGTGDTNQGMIRASGSHHVYQDNTLTKADSAQGIGSLYNTHKVLIENNYFFDTGYGSIHMHATPIGLKSSNTRYTVRGNKLILPANIGEEAHLFNYDQEVNDGEFCYNLFVRLGGEELSFHINSPTPTEVHFYRNTFVGNFRVHPDNPGPHYMDKNVLIGAFTGNTGALVLGDNIVESSAAGVLDDDYAAYRGTHGWEIFDSSDTTPPSAPSGLSVS